jgi:uncharacterized protein (TIGR03437 family)
VDPQTEREFRCRRPPFLIPGLAMLVCFSPADAQTVTASPSSFKIQYALNSPFPTPVTLQINAPGITFRVGSYPNIIDFVTVSPPSSTEFHDSATITLSFKDVNLGNNHMTDLSHLEPGPYGDPIIVVSPDFTVLLTIPLTLTITSPQPPAITSMVNGTSFLPGPVAPGEIVSILGSSLGAYTGDIWKPGPNLNLPSDLAGTSVFFNGSPAPLFYAQSSQINAVVPGSVAGLSSVSVVVNQGGGQSAPFTVPVAATAPGIFTVNGTGSGQAIVLNQDTSVNGPDRPAAAGTTVSMYATGSGVWNPSVPLGSEVFPPYPTPAADVSVTVGGIPSQVVSVAPPRNLIANTSMTLVSFVVPDGLASGPQPIILQIGPNSNAPQQVSMSVQ